MNQMFSVKVFIKALFVVMSLCIEYFGFGVHKGISRSHELSSQIFSFKVFINISWSRI